MLLIILNSLSPKNDERHRHRYEPLIKFYRQLFKDDVIFKRFDEIDTSKLLKENRLNGIMLGGMPEDYDQYPDSCWEEEFQIIRKAKVPLLGICGGFHLIAMAYNFRVVKKSNSNGEFIKEKGWREVNIIKDDPLFRFLPETIIVDEGHSWEIVALDKRFSALASNNFSRIQALRMNGRSLWGVQFHPEVINEEHPHGGIILQNFINML